MPITASLGALKQPLVAGEENYADTYWVIKRTDGNGINNILRFSPTGYLYCGGSNPEMLAINDYGLSMLGYTLYPSLADDIYSQEAVSAGKSGNYPVLKTTATDSGYQYNFPGILGGATSSGATVDNNNNSYFSFYSIRANLTRSYSMVSKFNSSGTRVWSNAIYLTATQSSYINISSNCTSGGIMYAYGTLFYQDTGGGATDTGNFIGTITNGNLSFLVYKATLTGSSPNLAPIWSIVKRMGSSYYALGTDSDYPNSLFLIKPNGTSSIPTKRINFSSSSHGGSLALNYAESNLYLTGTGWFIKFDSNLNIVYNRTITVDGSSYNVDVSEDGNGNLYVLTGNCVLKLPSDGTIVGTGTYTIDGTTIVYADVNPTTSIQDITLTTGSAPTSRVAYTTDTTYWASGLGYQASSDPAQMVKTIIS